MADMLDQAAESLASPSTSYAATTLFTFELYHALAHACILFRVRMLPKRDLVKLRYYFMIDLISVLSSALYTREYLWLAALQNLQHIYFFITWNKANYCIKVINWSSLDGLQKKEVDVTLGTGFDMVVHLVYAYCLSQYLTGLNIITSLVLLGIGSKLVLFNHNLAWANPDKVPRWVSNRVTPIQ